MQPPTRSGSRHPGRLFVGGINKNRNHWPAPLYRGFERGIVGEAEVESEPGQGRFAHVDVLHQGNEESEGYCRV